MVIRIFLLFTLTFEILAAQSIKNSPSYKLSNKVEKAQILGKTSAGLVIRKTGGIEILELYSKDLNLIGSKVIDTRDQFVVRVDIINDKIVYFFIKLQDTSAKLSVSSFEPNLKPLNEFKEVYTYTMSSGESSKNFKISASQGGLYTSIIKTKETEESISNIEVVLLDLNLELEFYKTLEIPVEQGRKKGIKKILVDLEGNTYLILDNKSVKVAAEDYRDFIVYKISKNEAPFKQEYAIDKEIFDLPKFIFDQKNKQIIMVSLYDNNNKGEPGSTGILYYNIDAKDLSLVFKSHETYNKEFLVKLTGRDINTIQEKLLTFRIKDVIITEEGNPIVFAESYFQSFETVRLQSSYFANNNIVENRTINIYNYNDIIGFQFDSKGKIEKEFIIRKKQITEDDGGLYSSYLLVNNGNKLYFLHTEGVGYNVDFIAQNLNKEGNAERKVLIADIDKNAPMLLKMAKQVSLDEVIIPSFRNNSFRLIKLNF